MTNTTSAITNITSLNNTTHPHTNTYLSVEEPSQCLVARGGKAHRSDHFGGGGPRGDVGLGNRPHAEALVEAARQEEQVVLGVKVHRGDEVGVREAVQAFVGRHVPQPHLFA